ncbi:MAG: cytochrome c biogenesis protein [Patescibacteria group bacterium]
MMRRLLFFVLTFAATWLVAMPTAQAKETFDVVMFYGDTCPHCHRAIEHFEGLQLQYPDLALHKFEVYSERENIPLFLDYAKQYDIVPGAVPSIFIGDQAFIGYNPEKLDAAIEQCAASNCELIYSAGLDATEPLPNEPPPEVNPSSDTPAPDEPTATDNLNTHLPPQPATSNSSAEAVDSNSNETLRQITLPAVIAGAAVDAINPCEFAVLIILITTVIGSGKRRRALYAGLAFCASIYISYFLMGLGLYSAIAAAGLSRVFYIIMAVTAIIIGLFNLKDWLWYGKWFVMEVPMSWRPRMQKLIRGVTSVPGAFLIGFVVSLFLLPCTSGPYVVILGLLAKSATRGQALGYLLLYNLIFILPMVLITLAVTFGVTSTEQAEAWRQSKLRFLHLVAGLIILGLGIIMLGSVLFGRL